MSPKVSVDVPLFVVGGGLDGSHTPGPWDMGEPHVGLHGYTGHDIYAGGEGGTWVASVSGVHVGVPLDRIASNAALIAAAPDLLAALERVTRLIGFEPSEPYGVEVLAAISKARAHREPYPKERPNENGQPQFILLIEQEAGCAHGDC